MSESEIEEQMLRVKSSCESFGTAFLSGDLRVFKQVRAAQNREREPYKIYSPQKSGGYNMTYDEKSSRLKAKFSK